MCLDVGGINAFGDKLRTLVYKSAVDLYQRGARIQFGSGARSAGNAAAGDDGQLAGQGLRETANHDS